MSSLLVNAIEIMFFLGLSLVFHEIGHGAVLKYRYNIDFRWKGAQIIYKEKLSTEALQKVIMGGAHVRAVAYGCPDHALQFGHLWGPDSDPDLSVWMPCRSKEANQYMEDERRWE